MRQFRSMRQLIIGIVMVARSAFMIKNMTFLNEFNETKWIKNILPIKMIMPLDFVPKFLSYTASTLVKSCGNPLNISAILRALLSITRPSSLTRQKYYWKIYFGKYDDER